MRDSARDADNRSADGRSADGRHAVGRRAVRGAAVGGAAVGGAAVGGAADGGAADGGRCPTPRGPAEIRVTDPAGPATALLVLGHGAGGDVDAPDLIAVHDIAVAAGLRVALVTQPYRVAGRRAPAPAAHLDDAWCAVVAHLRSRSTPALPLICGGRSSGARVACRTAGSLGAAGVLALAFPLHPPGRPERSRAHELGTGVPTLVVNGDRDPFGVPAGGPCVEVETRPGEGHDLRRDPAATAAVVAGWLRRHGWSGAAVAR